MCPEGGVTAPVGLVAEHPGKGNYSQALRFNIVCTVGFWTCLGPVTFFLSYFFLLEWECLLYICPTIVFWKHMTCLISQGHSWRGILPQNESALSLTHFSFRGDFRLQAFELMLELVKTWDGINVFCM